MLRVYKVVISMGTGRVTLTSAVLMWGGVDIETDKDIQGEKLGRRIFVASWIRVVISMRVC